MKRRNLFIKIGQKIFLFLVLFVFAKSGFACINVYRTLLSGEVIYTEPISGEVQAQEIDSVKLKEKSDSLLLAYKRSDSIAYYSDYGATLIYLGDFLKAKKVYEEIEQLQPNLYTTASNLGTIYELIDQPKLSLEWIKKSLELNPDSHQGSEWIHVKILEYKLSQSRDLNSSILELDFGVDIKPTNSNDYDLKRLKEQIWYQLRERVTLVKPPNNIVGNIFFDLGNVIAQTNDVQAALESYTAAKQYGFESELMDTRIEAFEKLALKAESSLLEREVQKIYQSNLKKLKLLGGGVIFLVGFIFLLFWMRK